MQVLALSNLASNTTNSNWTPTAGIRVSVLDSSNPNFLRTVRLDANALVLSVNNIAVEPVILTVPSFLAACAAANANITWTPIITSNPIDVTTATGNSASFSVTASAETSITYNWQLSTNAGFSWANASGGVYSGNTTTTLAISTVAGLNGTWYRCQVINATGTSLTTGANGRTGALLTVTSDPGIITQPVGATVTAPSGVTFTVVATGHTSLSYQWKQSTTGTGGSFSNVTNTGVFSGATTATLTISNATGLNGYAYEVVVTDSNGSVTSTPVPLTVH